MKKTASGVLLISLCAVLGLIIRVNYFTGAAGDTESAETALPGAAGCDEAEDKYRRLTIAAAGDVIMHSGINEEAETLEGYDYLPVMNGAAQALGSADLAICCLDAALTDGPDYYAYPMFKSPSAAAAGLRDAGFDLVSTAGNHSLDDLKRGIDKTLDVLDMYGLRHVGSYRTQAERDENNGIAVIEKNGISIAFLAYTYGTNGIDKSDFPYALNVFMKDYADTQASLPDYDLLRSDMAAARKLECDFIAVIVHWGTEYRTQPNAVQITLSNFLFTEGADMVLGSHPHVPQPIEFREVTDITGKTKNRPVIYSTGNFISCMRDRYTYITAVVDIELVKNSETGETYTGRVSYTPLFMADFDEYGSNNAGRRYVLFDLHKTIDAVEAGVGPAEINESAYKAMLSGLDDIHAILSKELDSYYTK